jgi:hypothetical protein
METVVLGLALILAVGILVWVLFNLIGEISAVAFVPTGQQEMEQVLEKLKLLPGKIFVDLGSGDGRVVRTATEKYGVLGIGYEIHPWLVLWARIRAGGIPNIKFVRQSLWTANISRADYIYCYLSPKAMRKLAKKIETESKQGTVIISKAFEIKELKKNPKEILEINNRRYFIYQN